MTTDRERQHQMLLMQVVIGAAWADDHLEPGEVTYLHKLLERYGLESNRKLQDFVSAPVPLATTFAWMVEYLRDTNETERHRAVVALADLFISDDQVVDVEHKILDEFHILMGRIPAQAEAQKPEHHDWLRSLGRWAKEAIAHFNSARPS